MTKSTTVRRAVLSGAMLIALLFSPVNAIVYGGDDSPGHGTPGKIAGDPQPTEDSWFEDVLSALRTLELLLPV